MSDSASETTEPLAAAAGAAQAGQAATTADAAEAAPSAASQPEVWPLPPMALPAVLAAVLVVLGGVLLMVNLGLLAPEAERAVQLTWPAGLIFAGLGLIVAGERLWKVETSQFTVERGDTAQADVVISAGTTDVHVDALSEAGGLAAGEWNRRTGPDVTAENHHTVIRLEPAWGLPALGGARWHVGLALDMPWRLNARTNTGNLDLDLTGLTVSDARLHSTFGDIDLTLPTAGGAELDISLAFGDLTVHVPDGLGVKVKLRQGTLAEVEHDDRRFIRLAPTEVGTPLYAVAARRCTLAVWLGTGDLRLL